MDRVAATQRPDRKVAGYQVWSELLFLHWPVPLKDLRPLVPAALDIDTYEGVAYVGLVPFYMSGVRPRWWPRALAFSFLETNMRTYVHVNGRDPGVYFFSLEAASRLAVWAARLGWKLPYYHARMSQERDGDTLQYRSRRRSRAAPIVDIRCQLGAPLPTAQPDSLEFFLFERYLLHVLRRDRVYTGQVHHAPYPVQDATLLHCDEELLGAAGLSAITGPPTLSHYSPGVDVEIFALQAQPDAADA